MASMSKNMADTVTVRANTPVMDMQPGDVVTVQRTLMVEGAISSGYLTVVEPEETPGSETPKT